MFAHLINLLQPCLFNVLPRLAIPKYPLMPGKHQALNDSTVNVIYFSLTQALERNDYGY